MVTIDSVDSSNNPHNHPEIYYAIHPFKDLVSESSYSSSAVGSQIGFLGIKSLECGKAYKIILKPGTGFVDIPEFQFSHSDSTDVYRLSLHCCAVETPTASPKISETNTETETVTETTTITETKTETETET